MASTDIEILKNALNFETRNGPRAWEAANVGASRQDINRLLGAGLRITTGDADGFHKMGLGEKMSQAKTFRACLLGLAAKVGWGTKPASVLIAINSMPESKNKDLLLSILKGE